MVRPCPVFVLLQYKYVYDLNCYGVVSAVLHLPVPSSLSALCTSYSGKGWDSSRAARAMIPNHSGFSG